MKSETLKRIEREAEEEFNKSLDAIENKQTTGLIEELYYIPKQFTKMVGKGNSRGLLLWGEAGLGKTYSVIKALKEIKKEFVLLTGHITSLELYNFLYENREKIIILDDINFLDNETNLNLLKSCLSENSNIVQYHTTSNKLRVPNKFIFNGKLIILLNSLPTKTESFKAVESRILNYELKFEYKTKIKLIYELSRQKYKKLSEEERQKVVRWIKENTSKATKNLNLRLLFQLYEVYLFSKEDFNKLSSKIVKTDRELLLIEQGLNQNDWCEETGKSRRTYFNRKSLICEVER